MKILHWIVSGLVASTLALPEYVTANEPFVSIDFESVDSLAEPMTIRTQFESPDQVPGIIGNAWRTDGFSSWASLPVDLSGAAGFTVATWLAIESFPSDLEVTVDRLSPSSIAHQRSGSSGFDIFMDTYGRWGLWVATNRGDVRVDAPGNFPLYEWAHVAATVDASARKATLYLNGSIVGWSEITKGAELRLANVDLELARSSKEVGLLNFTFNRLNGAYDEFKVYRHALGHEEVAALAAVADDMPRGEESLVVPWTRFANDHLRPKYHGMPPANWTNEPHGLVRRGDTWHLFYQRTPNGPFKTQMHWGHMASNDLVTWRHLPDALWPELQDDRFGFDQKGIWSGDVVIDGNTAYAFYTSVNHFHRLTASNPGVSMAVSTDPDLRTWKKMGPVANTEHVNDFRDPYLWREDDTWHMIIGAAIDTGGGLDYYVLESDKDGAKWAHRDRFSAVAYRLLDYGSIIWEMPVFEPLTEDVHILAANPIGNRVTKYGDPATRGVYWTGQWRDGLFHPFDNEPKMLDILPGHLAPTVARAKDGHLRAIGIVDERRTPQSQEDAGWAHTYSLPRLWKLMPDQRTLGQAPAPELELLRGEKIITAENQSVADDSFHLFDGLHAYELEIELDESLPDNILGLDILCSSDRRECTRIIFDFQNDEISLDLTRSTTSGDREGPDVIRGSYDRRAFGEPRNIRAFVDGSVIDVFINDAAAFAFRAYPESKDSTGVQLIVLEEDFLLSAIRAWALADPADHQDETVAALSGRQPGTKPDNS